MNGNNVTNNVTFRSNQSVSGNAAVSRVKKKFKYICYDKEDIITTEYEDKFVGLGQVIYFVKVRIK